jgi:hypothetical protein
MLRKTTLSSSVLGEQNKKARSMIISGHNTSTANGTARGIQSYGMLHALCLEHSWASRVFLSASGRPSDQTTLSRSGHQIQPCHTASIPSRAGMSRLTTGSTNGKNYLSATRTIRSAIFGRSRSSLALLDACEYYILYPMSHD